MNSTFLPSDCGLHSCDDLFAPTCDFTSTVSIIFYHLRLFVLTRIVNKYGELYFQPKVVIATKESIRISFMHHLASYRLILADHLRLRICIFDGFDMVIKKIVYVYDQAIFKRHTKIESKSEERDITWLNSMSINFHSPKLTPAQYIIR